MLFESFFVEKIPFFFFFMFKADGCRLIHLGRVPRDCTGAIPVRIHPLQARHQHRQPPQTPKKVFFISFLIIFFLNGLIFAFQGVMEFGKA